MSIFDSIFIKPPRRSKKNLTHDLVTSTDFSKIIPVLLEDLVPGDTFKNSAEVYIKMLPTLAPIFSQIEVRVDYFFVPNRLLWNQWEEFITGGPDGTSAPVRPFMVFSNEWLDPQYHYKHTQLGSLYDYFGLPVSLAPGDRGNDKYLLPGNYKYGTSGRFNGVKVDAMPFRAYSMIWNEYYRDQNLQDEASVSIDGGLDESTNFGLLNRGLHKDYFTSALPWTQRGPEVSIPLTGDAPVVTDDGQSIIYSGDNSLYRFPTDPPTYPGTGVGAQFGSGSAQEGELSAQSAGGTDQPVYHSHSVNLSDIHADLSEASAVTINELRRLNAVQKWLERNARAGARYVEQILSHFGIRTPDYRLDRPEYLGGNKQILGMAEILQTSQTTSDSPQGNRSGLGFGSGLMSSKRFRADEHGWVLGLMSIIPLRNTYTDGIDKKWLRESRFDYYFPEFQNLGEQAIENQELWSYAISDTGDSPMDDGEEARAHEAFGYNVRYGEYRYHPSKVTGQMRTSQSYWHMGRQFNAAPNLNGQFVDAGSLINKENYDRVFATDQDLGDRFSVFIRHHEHLKRPMQKNPQPSL